MLIVVRHGQTQVNAEGRLLGRADPELTELGREQAAALAAVVPSAARVISSPLRRARQTAAAIGEHEVDDRWIEIDYGSLEGEPLRAVDPQVWSRWRRDPAWAPAGGESLTAVGERVRAACEDLAATVDLSREDVVVVSHVSPIKAAAAWAMGVGDEVSWRMFLDVAAVSRITWTAERGPSLRSWNEVAHLGGTLRR